jgi:hypothetical protein
MKNVLLKMLQTQGKNKCNQISTVGKISMVQEKKTLFLYYKTFGEKFQNEMY